MKKLLKFISSISDDILMFAGAAFLFYGVWSIYPPAGFITLGIWLTAIACLIAKNK